MFLFIEQVFIYSALCALWREKYKKDNYPCHEGTYKSDI